MAAPAGNQFWKLRSKHGRDKLFSTPELLWEAATEYFEWAENHPWVKNEAVKAGDHFGELVQIPTSRPLTLHALCIYLDCSTSYFRAFKSTLKPEDQDFLTVITRIEEIIYNQKFEGAVVGAYNANIIARDLGLSEKSEVAGEIGLRQITGMVIK
jgi:hypothetical protein